MVRRRFMLILDPALAVRVQSQPPHSTFDTAAVGVLFDCVYLPSFSVCLNMFQHSDTHTKLTNV